MKCFTVKKKDNRWSLYTPQDKRFFTIGLNHIDETNLLYPDNIHIWEKKYGSHNNWIHGVREDMVKFNFNTVGWTQEVIYKQKAPTRGCVHSYAWETIDFEKCNMPYCVGLDIADISGWRLTGEFPDVYSKNFEEWCFYLARKVCFAHKDSENLLGYFLCDIPAWKKSRLKKNFLQLNLVPEDSLQYDEKLGEIADKYYSTIKKAIYTYDKNHLILGDRIDGNGPNIDVVIKAAAKYCDVISVQYFTQALPEKIVEMEMYFDAIYKLTGKPILLADIGNDCPTCENPEQNYSICNSQSDRAQDYIDSLSVLLSKDYFIGWHWCAYLENKQRGWGIKDYYDNPYMDFLNPVSEFNKKVQNNHISDNR